MSYLHSVESELMCSMNGKRGNDFGRMGVMCPLDSECSLVSRFVVFVMYP